MNLPLVSPTAGSAKKIMNVKKKFWFYAIHKFLFVLASKAVYNNCFTKNCSLLKQEIFLLDNQKAIN